MGVEEDLAISPSVSTVIGGLSGVIEVLMQQPLIAWKNAVQDLRPVPLDPRLLYRGVLVNAASIAPINGIQFGVNTFLEELIASDGTISELARTSTATVAGAVSGVVTAPAELLMIQQQKWGGSLADRLRAVASEHGAQALARGMNPTIVREAIFTGAYLGVIPILRDRMEAGWPEVFAARPVASLAAASVLAGVGASVATQPFDTVKTRMQANLGQPHFRTMSGTALQMWREGGSGALFRGLVPRAQRVTFAVFILSEAKERLTHLYLQLAPQGQHQQHQQQPQHAAHGSAAPPSPAASASRRVAHMEPAP